MRRINERFIDDLLTGELSYFLSEVKRDRDRLSLEIRDGYINIYYKGGNLLKITQKRKGYAFFFDARYCLNKGNDGNFDRLSHLPAGDSQAYIRHFHMMMEEMDSWFVCHPKRERDVQHELLLHNPSVLDVEYQAPYVKDGKRHWMRLDMLMVEEDTLILVENKCGIGAISGSAGIAKHYRDMSLLLQSESLYRELLSSVQAIAEAKYALGLLPKPIRIPDREKTELLFLLVDYHEESTLLKRELKEIPPTARVKVLMMDSRDPVIHREHAKGCGEYVGAN